MKKIKIKICNYDKNNTHSYGHFIIDTLKKYYEVELSDNPDYLFYNESGYDHFKYDCVKIFYTGENISPNFNSCDYAIGFDYLSFEDRYYRLPLYLLAIFYQPEEIKLAGNNYLNKQELFTKEDLARKTEFCSFVYSNYRADKERKLMFDKLCEYKKVNAGGAYLNNIGDRINNKLEFELKHKFSIAFENSSRSGYTTEKIVCSLIAKTIPIYWGNPSIGKEFNENRFINCHHYKSFDAVLEKVKELDANDELYIRTMNQPMFAESYDFENVKNGIDDFLKNIIDQSIDQAKRRTINPVQAIELKRSEALVAKYAKTRALFVKILATIYQPFKKIRTLEALKYWYFRGTKK